MAIAVPTTPSVYPGSPFIAQGDPSRSPDAEDRIQKIFTCQNFEWALRNPFDSALAWDNEFVTEQWSENYFIATKKDMALAKESIINFVRCLDPRDFHGKDAMLHLANAFALLGMLFMNIEGTSIIKGIIGMLSSTLNGLMQGM